MRRVKNYLGEGGLSDKVTGCGNEGEGRVRSDFQTRPIKLIDSCKKNAFSKAEECKEKTKRKKEANWLTCKTAYMHV